MEIFSALLALCAGNSRVTDEFLAQRPVTRSFDVSFDLRLNKRLSKQSDEAGDFGRHRAHYVTTVMCILDVDTQRSMTKTFINYCIGRTWYQTNMLLLKNTTYMDNKFVYVYSAWV